MTMEVQGQEAMTSDDLHAARVPRNQRQYMEMPGSGTCVYIFSPYAYQDTRIQS
jgi:hypothetical protein